MDRKRVLTEMAETPPVAVVLKERNIRRYVDTYRQKRHSYWWTVARQDLTEIEEQRKSTIRGRHIRRPSTDETLEVTKGEYRLYSEGETFDLHEYPGTSRLVHEKKLGGRVDKLRGFGLAFLVGGVIWWLLVWDN
ncbi:MAG: hypothetical protein V3U46_09170, partial [Acidimicrobiia bacterium]